MFKYGTWTSYLGIYAIKQGFDVLLYYCNVRYIDPSWFNLPRRKLMKKLKTALKKEKNKRKKDGLISLLDYIKEKGKIIFQIPSKNLIINYLKTKCPVIVCVTNTILHNKKRFDFKKQKTSEYGEPSGHFIVISGYENGNFIISDPSAKYGGICRVSEDKLLFSWLFWGGDALIIKPKN